jgi:hypothetical protein
MAETKSKSRNKGKDTSRNEASGKSNEASNVATSKGSKQMADNNSGGLPSVVEFDEDIGNAEAPVPLPVGDYQAEIRGATRKLSANSGNEYAAVQFFIPADQYPADYTEGEPDGTILTFNRVSLQNTPASRHRLRKFLEAIGAPTGKKIDLNEWIGRTAFVSVQHDTYEGEQRAAIGKVTAA